VSLAAIVKRLFVLALAAWALNPSPALACATCFGKSDSPLAQGMNMGILALLGVITTVLCGVAGFFVFLGRQSAKHHARLSGTKLAENITRSST
jgi:hypothetical protein